MSQTIEESSPIELFQQLEGISPERLQRLLTISTTLSSTLDLKQLLSMVIDAATDLTETEYASILLWDQTSDRLSIAATNGTDLAVEKIVPIEGSLAGEIVRQGRPLIINDLDRERMRYAELDSTQMHLIQNMLGVPLITKGKVIGALETINKREAVVYNQQDVAILQALASQAAVAIENARLFQRTDLIDEFMHELKTPLMALTAASELLARESVGDKQRELIEMIQQETVRLSNMAQDFLDLARLESGQVQLAQEPVDLGKLVHEVIRMQNPQAAVRNITIDTHIPDMVPAVNGDYDRLKQVLINLTSNAIKYNFDEGRVVIDVGVQNNEVIIKISDTGPGIAKENLPHLFERFYRIPDSEGFTRGTGLGLSISARIIQEHGGRIEIRSEKDQGSTFCCYLPASL